MAAPIPTVDEVESLTGVTVEENAPERAATILEVFVGRPQGVWDQLPHRDQRTLKLAIAYEAAWLASHPEALAAMDVESFSQLDQSLTLRDSSSMLLAPLAKRALKRLSWRGIRSVGVTTDFQSSATSGDHEGHWSPL